MIALLVEKQNGHVFFPKMYVLSLGSPGVSDQILHAHRKADQVWI